MRKQFWKQVSKQVCWTDPTNSGERWEAWLKIHIGDTGSSEIKGMNELLVAYLYKTRDMVIGAPEAAMKPYRLSIKIGNGDIRSALKTRLDGCFFETPEEGKKTLKNIISTIDMSSLAH